ncbi:MAG: VacJ family lipoprotein [Alphaproteobacteria bacterium]|nr:VacJ family lipoprotein [Alphaproteobacteria bacterium]
MTGEPKSAKRLWAALAAGLLLCACAETPEDDPYEATNRAIFAFNQRADRAVARPVAEFYLRTAPDSVRRGVHNFLTNLGAPAVLANELLQARPTQALETAGGLAVNTTLGIGGFVDAAARLGIPQHESDFGITLGKWGFREGPYLMLPLLGPAPPRDLTGKIADVFLDPTFYVSYGGKTYAELGVGALNIVDWRAANIDTLDNIERTSIDYYATTRSLYLQYRKAKVEGGAAADTPDAP